jgi:uncharacterized protein DUF455
MKDNQQTSPALPQTSGVPVLAGICTWEEAARSGLGVEKTVKQLRRYVFIKSQLVKLIAGHFNGVPEWEVKGALGLHLWQDAEHSTWLRKRITEMRTPPLHLDKVPDPALEAFLGELINAANTLELLSGLYLVLKPALVASYTDYLQKTHPIADQPSRRIIGFMLQEEREQVEWGQKATAALLAKKVASQTSSTLDSWQEHLRSYLEAAGGVDGEQSRRLKTTLPPARNTKPFEPQRVPQRDERFPHVWRSRGKVPAMDRPVHERMWWLAYMRLQEMHVPELIASVLYDWKNQPWEFYHDLARHLWDEVRHSMFGEIEFGAQGIDFTKMPCHVGFAEYPNLQHDPIERYAFLWGIEQGLMAKTGKQAEVALVREAGDDMAEVFQDFDWADEVLHAQIGRRWLDAVYSREQMSAVYERVRAGYDKMKEEDLKREGADWWEKFYNLHLKDIMPLTKEHSTESKSI